MRADCCDFIKLSMCSILASQLPVTVNAAPNPKSKGKNNVLFILVEDCKNIMGCYGNPLIHTPNIDILAKKGVRFDNAYCQYPVCNPSRSSLMTGLQVDTLGIYDNLTPWNTHLKDPIITMPGLFKDNGYHTIRLNKVLHGKKEHDDPTAWSEIYDLGTTPLGLKDEGRNMTNGEVKWCSWLAAEGTDEDQQDGRITTKAIELIKEKRDKPFFIALGLAKPHDPYNAPKKYFDLYF